ncbi:MAG: AlbA family DNA-binding domain-containing protein [Nitrososphaeraceae archaeon]
MEVQDILDIVEEFGETRSIELKKSMSWQEKETQFKITKSIMAFSNIRDGGKIILGVEGDKNGRFEPKGMDTDDFASFKQDLLSDHINTFASPFVDFRVHHVSNNILNFIVRDVKEFNRAPMTSLYASNVSIFPHFAHDFDSDLFSSLQLGHCFGLKSFMVVEVLFSMPYASRKEFDDSLPK